MDVLRVIKVLDGTLKIKDMSTKENDEFLEAQYYLAENAVMENDVDGLANVYLTLEESGFSKEAQALRDQFGVLSV
jgi:hypothetical protein